MPSLPDQLDSAELARRLSLNPYNLPGVTDAPALCPHDYAAARFEAEGRVAYAFGRNPYLAGTMACTRWAMGWHQADAAFLASHPEN
jgi:hypothetical protein